MRSHRRKLEIYHQIKNGTYDTAPFEKSSLMPPFYSFSEKFLISPRYKISQCLIEKVISTITEAIFCYIDNPVEFEANNRTISTESYEIRFCEERHQRSSALAARDAVGRDRIEFALVRDPIDRFLSGFVDKCINHVNHHWKRCYSCGRDLDCFISHLTIDLLKAYSHGPPGVTSFLPLHFAPQTWYCNFGNNYPDYFILKYENGAEGVAQVAEKFREIFKKAQLPEHMRQKIYDEMMIGRTHHSTFDSDARRSVEEKLMNNKALLLKLTQLYYYDFVLFDFKMPVLI
ncbi:hypothetical protein Q1695_004733 [Nippostrongylus brasiliensis]|nr:hypothetical protein Q1695_004733 [Nippostrongylus brasiliensis]